MYLPSSSRLPGPTARTRPRCGFSFAVSGSTMPLVVVSSSSRTSTMRRSPSGFRFIQSLLTACSVTVPGTLPSRVPGALYGRHSRRASANRQYCGMPFTVRNLKDDLEDIGSVFDGHPDLEFRAATKPLELEQSGLTHQRVPAGYRFPYGHTHQTQEEVYVVVRGSGRMKLDDEIVELREWDAVRVPPGTWRGYEAGPDGLELLVIGAPNLGEDPRDDVDGRRDWWTD